MLHRSGYGHRENQHITILAYLNSPGILVLANSFYPCWRVYVNGNESKIVRATFFFRGIPLPPGEYVIMFRTNRVPSQLA